MPDRWLTYAEAGELFGLSAEAMRNRTHRLSWRTQPGNEGRTLILVPDGAELHPAAHPAGHRADDRADELFAEALCEARRRTDAAEARARDLAEGLAQQREARARAEGEAAVTRDALAQERAARQAAEGRLETTRAELAAWTAGGPPRAGAAGLPEPAGAIVTTEVVAEVLVMVLALALAIVASGSSATLPDGIRLGLLALATGAFLLAVLRREGLL